MLRTEQEKEQLVRKFEEIAPWLKDVRSFGWYANTCGRNPWYKIYPDDSKVPVDFRPFEVNIRTGWHSEIVRFVDSQKVVIPEGYAPVDDDWVDVCYHSCCQTATTL